MSDYLDINNEELLKDFFSEAEQMVENLESNILVIENDPTDHDAIDEIFRAAHTLKGSSATVEMSELAGFCHDVEDLLDPIRSREVEVTEDIVDVLLKSIDTIKAMLETRTNGQVYSKDISDLVAKIKSYIPASDGKKKAPPKPAGMISKTAPVQAPAAQDNGMPPLPVLSEYEVLELQNAAPEDSKIWAVNVTFDESNPMNSVGGIQVFARLKETGTVIKTVPDFDDLYSDNFYFQVVYYIATEADQDTLEDAAYLTDVTLACDASLLPVADPASASAPVAETPVQDIVPPAPEHAETVEQATPKAVEGAKKSSQPNKAVNSGSILRVDSKRIDSLLNLVSETVIVKAAFNQNSAQLAALQNQLQVLGDSYREKCSKLFDDMSKYLEQAKSGKNISELAQKFREENSGIVNFYDSYTTEFKNAITKNRSSTQNLGRITGELQEGVMKIRMVPISQIFSRFPRVVRDLSRDLGRKVNLVIEGEDTELDKAVTEDLLDPIMHCVRNSVDHGIETPAERIAAGKDETGTLLLKAFNEGNQIIIEIADDGAGIDVNKVREKAIKKGLVHPSKALTDQEVYNLIFMPGFSTSDKITNVSGRGVGLDVVRTMINKLNGSVSVTSELGKGTKFTIKLPLTMAIIQGLLVNVGQEIYSIPIANVIESQRVPITDINTIDNYEVLNVRNEVISILRLSRLFNIKNTNDSENCFIVIVGSQEKKIGIMVDSLIGEEDVVIKPLRDKFTASPAIAGASILGDGSVSLIIDVSRLLELGVQQEITAKKEREMIAARG